MLTKISKQVHKVNKTLFWKVSSGSTHRTVSNGEALITGLMWLLLQLTKWEMTGI